MKVHMTVFYDAVKLETEYAGRRCILGWFRDEVSAVGAAAENLLMDSAMLSSLRKLKPELVICSEYKNSFSNRIPIAFKRATRVKLAPEGRRVVRVPGTFGKVWV